VQIVQPTNNYKKEVSKILARKLFNPRLLFATLQLGQDYIIRQRYRREFETD
jgi:hypothetical protein